MPYLVIAPSKGGRGVFTTKKIPAGTVIEVSPVLVLTRTERKTIEKTKLADYIFEWGDSRKQGAVALGYVSMYNHEYESNCEYDMDYDTCIMTVRTVKVVKKGEELSINYNADPNDKTPVWFDDKIKKHSKAGK